MSAPYLTRDQVHSLNEKHGWFEFGDSQSDVSRAFAQDAIEMHERMRRAAPALLKALQMVKAAIYFDENTGAICLRADFDELVVDAAIAKATS